MFTLIMAAALAGFDSQFTTWPGGRLAALSLVFDDGRNDHRDIADPELTARGLVGTFALIPGASWATKGPQFQIVASHGHELANHTMLHQTCKIQTAEEDAAIPPPNTNFHSLEELAADCVTALGLIDAIQARQTVAFVYPGGSNETQTRAVIAQHHLCARLSTSGIHINPPSPTDLMQLQPLYVGGAQPTVSDWCDFADVDDFFDTVLTTLLTDGGWVIEEYHDIECPGYAALNMDAWLGHLDELAAMSPVVWVGGMGDVARYTLERDAAMITVLDEGASFVTLSVDDGLPDGLYDLPLTVETIVPSAWGSVSVAGGGGALPHIRIGDVVRFDTPPDGQPILIGVNEWCGECMCGPEEPTLCAEQDEDSDGDLDLYDFHLLQLRTVP